jgi:PAS domain S-box-containing protein
MLPDRRELALVALERTRMPMVITDATRPDNPIVLANQAFLDLTGYGVDEVLGRNCRFLQGPETAEEAIELIRRGLRAGDHHIDVELLNYRKDGSAFWNQLAISPVYDEGGGLIYYFASQKDVTSRREVQKLEASERLLLMEVDHRAMNALALVRSIVALSRADSVERFSRSVKGRVDALARAHRLLGQSGWQPTRLRDLIVMESEPDPVPHAGPDVALPPKIVQPLCLAVHELVTNAREHGGLSVPGGKVAVTWEVAADKLVLRWSETGVAIDPADPPHGGLGMDLIRGTVEQQLGGRLALDWRADGLEAAIRLPWYG